MSTKGIYTALSGAMAQNLRLDTIANNIANVNTPAFKKDNQVFKEYLSSYEKPANNMNVPRIPASIESFYDMQGGDKAYVDATGTYTDYSQGALKPTNNPLDLSIDGKGFFEVLTPAGIRYTRNGGFKLDQTGRMVTREGFPVLKSGAGGAEVDLAARSITLKSDHVHVTEQGEIFDGNQSIGKIALVDFVGKDALDKVGSSLYKVKNTVTTPPIEGQSNVKQGFLELSNVDVVREMTEMISATRTFESTQRAIKAYDGMAEKMVNSVPKLE